MREPDHKRDPASISTSTGTIYFGPPVCIWDRRISQMWAVAEYI